MILFKFKLYIFPLKLQYKKDKDPNSALLTMIKIYKESGSSIKTKAAYVPFLILDPLGKGDLKTRPMRRADYNKYCNWHIFNPYSPKQGFTLQPAQRKKGLGCSCQKVVESSEFHGTERAILRLRWERYPGSLTGTDRTFSAGKDSSVSLSKVEPHSPLQLSAMTGEE
ncbi:hypothetical protein DSO57_1014446 [Entomophthora muscae]|uniref:Uncharacterized protein n=1 Tax=Entomophthora muscae TaxID=34485 RepID=A0ACC2RKC7_9FUNG|nr:hypothetical protein DSO57_1014446 [Entomophthora muscae]